MFFYRKIFKENCKERLTAYEEIIFNNMSNFAQSQKSTYLHLLYELHISITKSINYNMMLSEEISQIQSCQNSAIDTGVYPSSLFHLGETLKSSTPEARVNSRAKVKYQ